MGRSWRVGVLRGVIASLRGAGRIAVAMGTAGADGGTPCASSHAGAPDGSRTAVLMTHDVACATGVPVYRVTADDVSFDVVADGGAWS